MALLANGHESQDSLADDKDKSHGFVEIVEPKDRAYFKAQLLDVNHDIHQYYVRYYIVCKFCLPIRNMIRVFHLNKNNCKVVVRGAHVRRNLQMLESSCCRFNMRN